MTKKPTLLERLKDPPFCGDYGEYNCSMSETAAEAADEIERQAQEIVQLNKALKLACGAMKTCACKWDDERETFSSLCVAHREHILSFSLEPTVPK